MRGNLLRRTVLAVDETHPKDEGEARRCEETGSESRDIHSACVGEDEAAPQAECLRETQHARSRSGHACLGYRAQAEHVVSFLAGTPVRNDENVVGNWHNTQGT